MNDKPKKQYDIAAIMNENINAMRDVVPWANETRFRVTKVEKGHVFGTQPWVDHLVGDPETGVIHGGVITTFLDNLCGMACTSAMTEMRFVATVDLRIDYMRPAEPGRDVFAHAECYKVTRLIAFVRGFAYHDDKAKPIANATATFMFTGQGKLAQATDR